VTDELIFYTHPMSRGRIVRWMLEEIGHPYRTELLDFGTTMKAPEYLSLNPMGKVPAIRHGDTVVTECAAICAYLADAFPQAGLAPRPGDRLRGTYYRWMFFAAGPVEAAVKMKNEASWDMAEALLLRARMVSRRVCQPKAKKPREEIGPSAFVQRLILRRLFGSRKGKPK
jgi:glutathione S-transferase